NAPGLEIAVVGPRATLGRDPGDGLIGIGNIAGLAVHAVGSVDLQMLFAGLVLDNFVDAGRAIARAGVAVFLGASGHAHGGVGNLQVHWLILVVRDIGVEHRRQAIARRQVALDVVVVEARLVELAELLMIGVIAQCARQLAGG